ncbi:MAG TPA: thiolase family protein [Verrucomicrobiaceae bacterium]|jgi:acetyl-CoA C-acetyltransferase/acetyl-CoA acyltransferase
MKAGDSMVVVGGLRTPFCRAGTALAGMDAAELGRAAVSALLTKFGLDPAQVDETIFGCVAQPADAPNIARVIALRAGIPRERPAMTVQRNCASGLQAITTAWEKLSAGQGEVFIVGGVESMSRMPLQFRHEAALKFATLAKSRGAMGRARALSAFRLHDLAPVITLRLGLTDPVVSLNMGQTAELLAREYRISREVQDAFAVRSHLLAHAHRAALAEEIAPVYVRNGGVTAVTQDNGVRADSTLEKLAALRPIFDPVMGSVTAGNSSQISDGAVALLVCSERKAEVLGLRPLGRLVSQAWTGCDPARMGLGPVTAMAKALHAAGWTLDDADIVEINEAFAAQVLAVLKCLKDPASARRAGLDGPLGELDHSRLNPQGGAIALGHPVGATGARLVLTALHQLRNSKRQRAVVSLCIGGGQGGALCLEAIS